MPAIPILEQLLGSFDVGIFTADADGLIHDLNQAAALSLGYGTREEALADEGFGQIYFSFVADWAKASADAVQADGHTVRRRIVHHRRNGQMLSLDMALVYQSDVRLFHGAFRDVTVGEERARRTAELEALQRLAVDALRLDDEKRLTKAMLDVCIGAVCADGGAIYTYHALTEELQLVASMGLTPSFLKRVSRMRMDEGFTGRVARTREPVFLECLRESSHLEYEELRELRPNNFVSYPLIDRNHLRGVLNLFTIDDRKFSNNDLALLNVLTPQASLSLAHMQRFEELRQRNEDLEKFNRLAVDRELRMIELKMRIRSLEQALAERTDR